MNSQWDNIIKRLGGKAAFSIDTFRGAPEYMLYGTFDPRRFGSMYLKTLIYNEFHRSTPLTKQYLRAIPNRNKGGAFGISCGGEFICLDYLMAAFECEFLAPFMGGVERVIEVGAGFGRTCHALLSNFSIHEYAIVDLPFSLEISAEYLRHVLPTEQWQKVRFISHTDYAALPKVGPTLVVNIDSMGEMQEHTINEYLRFIDKCADYFYCNNALGKYRPEDVGEVNVKSADFNAAMSAGKLPGGVNIFDRTELEGRIQQFIEGYTPDTAWRTLKSDFTRVYPHYYQVLYQRDSRDA